MVVNHIIMDEIVRQGTSQHVTFESGLISTSPIYSTEDEEVMDLSLEEEEEGDSILNDEGLVDVYNQDDDDLFAEIESFDKFLQSNQDIQLQEDECASLLPAAIGESGELQVSIHSIDILVPSSPQNPGEDITELQRPDATPFSPENDGALLTNDSELPLQPAPQVSHLLQEEQQVVNTTGGLLQQESISCNMVQSGVSNVEAPTSSANTTTAHNLNPESLGVTTKSAFENQSVYQPHQETSPATTTVRNDNFCSAIPGGSSTTTNAQMIPSSSPLITTSSMSQEDANSERIKKIKRIAMHFEQCASMFVATRSTHLREPSSPGQGLQEFSDSTGSEQMETTPDAMPQAQQNNLKPIRPAVKNVTKEKCNNVTTHRRLLPATSINNTSTNAVQQAALPDANIKRTNARPAAANPRPYRLVLAGERGTHFVVSPATSLRTALATAERDKEMNSKKKRSRESNNEPANNLELGQSLQHNHRACIIPTNDLRTITAGGCNNSRMPPVNIAPYVNIVGGKASLKRNPNTSGRSRSNSGANPPQKRDSGGTSLSAKSSRRVPAENPSTRKPKGKAEARRLRERTYRGSLNDHIQELGSLVITPADANDKKVHKKTIFRGAADTIRDLRSEITILKEQKCTVCGSDPQLEGLPPSNESDDDNYCEIVFP